MENHDTNEYVMDRQYCGKADRNTSGNSKNAAASGARIQWIDGVRAILTIWILLFHYTLSFINTGYVGFGSNYSQEEAMHAFAAGLPLSLFTNSRFALYMFLVLIAFIPAYKFFGDHEEDSIRRQAKKRYLRLMIPTFLACVINFIFHHAGLLMHIRAGEASGVVFLQQLMGVDFSFPNLLYEGLILAYVKGSQYVATTWVMGYIFIGSFFGYGVLLLFGKMKNRISAYISLFVFFFVFDQMYLCFLAGIIAADIVKSRQLQGSSAMSPLVSGFLIAAGLLIGFIPDLILPKPLQVYTLAAAGAALLIVGLSGAQAVRHFLENRVLKVISDYSFSAILIHIPIMAVVSCRQYLVMADLGISKGLIILSVFIAAIPVQILAAFLFQKLVDLISLPVSGCTAR